MLDNQQLQEKIVSLEHQISQLSTSLDDLHNEGQATPAVLPAKLSTDAADKAGIDEPKWRQLVLPVLLSSLSWPVLFTLTLLGGGLQTQSWLMGMGGFIWFLFPLGCGIWAGLRWQGRRLREYVSLWLSVFLVHLPSALGFQYLILGSTSFSMSFLLPGLGFFIVQTLLLVLAAFATTFWIRVGLTERVLAIEPKRGRITLAMLLPVLFWSVLGIFYNILFGGNYNPIFVLPIVLFLCVLLISPLVSGFWIGLKWPGRHLIGYGLLGAITGVLANIGFLIGEGVWWWIHKLSLSEMLTSGGVWNTSTISVVLLFLAGGLFADLLKNKANPHLTSERGYAQQVAAKLADPGQEPSRKTVLLIQLLAPLFTTLIGLVTALIGLYRSL